MPWCVKEFFDGASDSSGSGASAGAIASAAAAATAVEAGMLHCIDNMAHEHTTAHRVSEVAQRLGLDQRLRLHVADAFDEDLPAVLQPGTMFDFMCAPAFEFESSIAPSQSRSQGHHRRSHALPWQTELLH